MRRITCTHVGNLPHCGRACVRVVGVFEISYRVRVSLAFNESVSAPGGGPVRHGSSTAIPPGAFEVTLDTGNLGLGPPAARRCVKRSVRNNRQNRVDFPKPHRSIPVHVCVRSPTQVRLATCPDQKLLKIIYKPMRNATAWRHRQGALTGLRPKQGKITTLACVLVRYRYYRCGVRACKRRIT